MRAEALRGKRIAIWGFGREGRAALRFLRERGAGAAITVLDDAQPHDVDAPLISGRRAIAEAIDSFDVVVKSPGVSLYDPLVARARESGVHFTSLLNLWFADRPIYKTICVTGTKGKSTTSALLAHILRGIGLRAMAAGNIGVPITELPPYGLDAAIIEVSSYQAADFSGLCDISVLTSLHQEHLDWHGSVKKYRNDKVNLLRHSRRSFIHREALAAVSDVLDITCLNYEVFDTVSAPLIGNGYIARPHNLRNLAAALAVVNALGKDHDSAIEAARSFKGLPHRQHEIGELDGVLFVDDSISTTPEATVAALDSYSHRPITLILGGYDRDIDYSLLVTRLQSDLQVGVVVMDASGKRIAELLGSRRVEHAASMLEAVSIARSLTPKGGVVLLSPAAPSYGRYQNFIERGEDFAFSAGIKAES
jgi:UDP-N-acetylmuramoylalanine--D-glutamate ligase